MLLSTIVTLTLVLTNTQAIIAPQQGPPIRLLDIGSTFCSSISDLAPLDPSLYPIRSNDSLKQRTAEAYDNLRQLLYPNADYFVKDFCYPYRQLTDEVLMAAMIGGEFEITRYTNPEFYAEALEAASFLYNSDGYWYGCHGHCDTVTEQLNWLLDVQAFRDIQSETLADKVINDLSNSDSQARLAMKGYVHDWPGSIVWGNYMAGSKMEAVANGGTADWIDGAAFTALDRQWNAVVFTAHQRNTCHSADCVGWRP